MPYPNSDLHAWQLVLLVVVVAVSMATWLILVYRAAREPGRQNTPLRDVPALPADGPGPAGRGQREQGEVKAA